VSPDQPSSPDWATCRTCGGAVPPAAEACPTCGATGPAVRSAEIARLPPRLRRRVRTLQLARVAVVLVVVVGLIYAIGSAVWTGAPTFPDPLTTRGTLSVGAGNFTYLSGWITGEDYIDGNFTVVYPVGVPISFEVFNATEFTQFLDHRSASAIWSTPNETSARIVFAAPYTDQFYLVFENPYPPSSGIDVQIYEVTNYQTNVVIG
jgi:hypothetical protein